jgi:uncharacterized protein YecA (UPF0149 family)
MGYPRTLAIFSQSNMAMAMAVIANMVTPPSRPRTTPRPRGPVPAVTAKAVGRNAPCPCASGKKFKKCCAP